MTDVIESTVTGLGYELVDVERSGRGLLRVFIDRMPGAEGGEFITVEDCERVTRQLQHVLEVEACAYERLEVSSPGLDRPLKKPAHFVRFAGEQIELTLRVAFQGRKKYRGVLQSAPGTEAVDLPNDWRLVFNDGAGEQALDFSLQEMREARLVPVVDFKGRRFAAAPAEAQAPVAQTEDREDGGPKE